MSAGDPRHSRVDTNIQQDNKDKGGSRESPRSDKSKLTCCARASAAAISSPWPIHAPSFLISSSPRPSFFATRLYVGLSVSRVLCHSVVFSCTKDAFNSPHRSTTCSLAACSVPLWLLAAWRPSPRGLTWCGSLLIVSWS